MPHRPNVLILMSDQQRADALGCYGNEVCRTPSLDLLAGQGALMENAYVSNPLCMPNRATLWTGRYPSAHGVRTNGIPLAAHEITLPQVMAAAGYRTACFGKLHLQPFGILECRFPDGRRDVSYESFQFWRAEGPWMDARAFWHGGDRLPLPFYGFQEVALAVGHGEGVTGHYGLWLDSTHPGLRERLGRQNALRTPSGAPQSWKSAMPAECHPTRWVCDQTIDFLRRQAHEERPFLAVCSIPDPHHPFVPPAPYCFMYDEADIPLPERRPRDLEAKPPHYRAYFENGLQTSGTGLEPTAPITAGQWREIIAHTYGMVTQIDDGLGRVLECLEATGLADDTLVLFTTDHGDLLGDHGLLFKGPFNLEGLVRVPLLWRLPGVIPAGVRLGGLCGTVDIAETILAFAGVAPPPGMQGVPLKDYLLGGEAPRDCLLIENDEDYLGLRLRTLITPEWKLTAYGGREYGELYSRHTDPGEFENLWDDPNHGHVRQELLGSLLDLLIETDDTLPPRFAHA